MVILKKMKSPRRFVLLLPLAFAVLGCEAPSQQTDYRKTFPITVSTKAYTMALTAPVAGVRLVGESAVDFRRFINYYHDRGRSVITIEASAGTDDQALAASRRARDLLIEAGLRPEKIAIVRGAKQLDATGSVLMSFTGGVVKVSECGDFSSNPNFNWANKPHTNFGCAYQRNLGLTVADPGDLKTAKAMSGGDATKAIGVFEGWRAPAEGAGGAAGAVGAAAGATAQ